MNFFEFSLPCPRGNACYRNFFPPSRRRIYLDPFNKTLFVTPKSSLYSKEKVIRQMVDLPGYVAHKFFHCGSNPIHLYVRFQSPAKAHQAKIELNYSDPALRVEFVSAFLSAFFELQLELKIQFMWTPAYVDRFVKDLDEPTLGQVLPNRLADYGNPGVVFSKSVKFKDGRVDHAYISFPSLAEALGACINFGCWQRATCKDGYIDHDAEKDPFRIVLHKGPQFKCLLNSVNEDYCFQQDYFFQDGGWDLYFDADYLGLELNLNPVDDYTSPEDGHGGGDSDGQQFSPNYTDEPDYQNHSSLEPEHDLSPEEGYGGSGPDGQQYSPNYIVEPDYQNHLSSREPEHDLSPEEGYGSNDSEDQQYSPNYSVQFEENSEHQSSLKQDHNLCPVEVFSYDSVWIESQQNECVSQSCNSKFTRDSKTREKQYGHKGGQNQFLSRSNRNINNPASQVQWNLDQNEVNNSRRSSTRTKPHGSKGRRKKAFSTSQSVDPNRKNYKSKVVWNSSRVKNNLC